MSLTHKEFLQEQKTKLLDQCDLCGKCLKQCPIIPCSELRDYNAIALQKKIMESFRVNQFSHEVLDFALICSNCLRCDTLCPVEGFYPSRRSEIIKSALNESGQTFSETAAFFVPGERYFAFEVLSSLLMGPSEIRWMEEIPEKKQKTEVVYFLGCVAQTDPGNVFTSIDILSQVTQDFITLGGGINACCGGIHTFMGCIEEGEMLAKKLLEGISIIFQPQTVVFFCPTCLSVLKSKFSSYMSDAISYQHISTFLADNLESLSFKHNLNQSITVHDSCHLTRGVGEYDSPRKILSRIPGVDLVEMRHNKDDTLCCGAAAGFFDPEPANALAAQRLDEAKACGAEVIATLCHSCQTSFLPGSFTHGISARLLTDLVGEAMGIQHEDKLGALMALGDSRKIIDAARENIEASKYTLEEMRTVLPKILGM